jgi:hypothetical protein
MALVNATMGRRVAYCAPAPENTPAASSALRDRSRHGVLSHVCPTRLTRREEGRWIHDFAGNVGSKRCRNLRSVSLASTFSPPSRNHWRPARWQPLQMKGIDPEPLGIGAVEEIAERRFARSAAVIEGASQTTIRCARTPIASSLVAAFVLFVSLALLACVAGLASLNGLLVALVTGIVGLLGVLSGRESVAVSAAAITIQPSLRPFVRSITIPSRSVTSVRVESFQDSPWDRHVTVVTPTRTFRIAAGISESAAQEVARAIRDRLSAG